MSCEGRKSEVAFQWLNFLLFSHLVWAYLNSEPGCLMLVLEAVSDQQGRQVEDTRRAP